MPVLSELLVTLPSAPWPPASHKGKTELAVLTSCVLRCQVPLDSWFRCKNYSPKNGSSVAA